MLFLVSKLPSGGELDFSFLKNSLPWFWKSVVFRSSVCTDAASGSPSVTRPIIVSFSAILDYYSRKQVQV